VTLIAAFIIILYVTHWGSGFFWILFFYDMHPNGIFKLKKIFIPLIKYYSAFIFPMNSINAIALIL